MSNKIKFRFNERLKAILSVTPGEKSCFLKPVTTIAEFASSSNLSKVKHTGKHSMASKLFQYLDQKCLTTPAAIAITLP